MSLRGADKANFAEVQVIDPFVVHVVAMTCPVRGKQGNTWSLIHGTLPRHQISACSDIGVSFARSFYRGKKNTNGIRSIHAIALAEETRQLMERDSWNNKPN